MKQQLVFTILAADKTGIITTIAELVNKHEGNWLDSRMSQLAGEFAGIVHIEIPMEKRKSLETAFAELSSQGISITVKESGGENAESEKHITIEVFGNDRAGIVTEVTKLFSEKNMNIVELDTNISDTPHSGGVLFHADLVVGVAKNSDLDELQDKLHHVADALMLDIEWTSRL